jgi:hypothetical protein
MFDLLTENPKTPSLKVFAFAIGDEDRQSIATKGSIFI